MTTPIKFELAKLLKEKGYNEPCKNHYEIALTSKKDREDGYTGPFGWKKGECNLQSGYNTNESLSEYYNDKTWSAYSAPNIIEVVMWLYEKHGVWIWVSMELGYNITFCWQLTGERISSNYKSNFKTPTEAYEAAIEYTLKNLI
jgi:hypothetical protein